MKADVAVIGGGAVGVGVGYYLAHRGNQVVVAERDTPGHACSYGNSGIIAVSHCMPLATRKSLYEGLRWLIDPNGPVAIKPRLDRDFARWLGAFVGAAWRDEAKSKRALYELGIKSLTLHRELAAISTKPYGFADSGWLQVYRSNLGLRRATQYAQFKARVGVRSEVLSRHQAAQHEPTITDEIVGGINYLDDAHVNPFEFVQALAFMAEQSGARIISGTPVIGFTASGDEVDAVITPDGPIKARQFVIAAGAWSGGIARMLGIRLPVQPAKGHSITFQATRIPQVPVMLGEKDISITPEGDRVRITTGLELAGFDPSLSARRLSAAETATKGYLDGMEPTGPKESWIGYRPMTPDDLPVIGRSQRWKNLWFATGHGTLGITLGPVTGWLMAELMDGHSPDLNMQAFSPARFGI